MLRQSESSLTKIAVALNRSKSTISRELRRNQSPPGEYWPDTAQCLALTRKKRGCQLDSDQSLKPQFGIRSEYLQDLEGSLAKISY